MLNESNTLDRSLPQEPERMFRGRRLGPKRLFQVLIALVVAAAALPTSLLAQAPERVSVLVHLAPGAGRSEVLQRTRVATSGTSTRFCRMSST